MPISILVLAFIAAQTAAAAALSLRAESLAVTRPSTLSVSTLSAVCLSVRSLLREYAMSCSRHAASSGFMPSSSLASRFVSPGRKTDSSKYVTRKEARLSLDSADRCATLTFATVLYLRCGAVDVHPLPRLIVMLVAATIGRTSESAFTCSGSLSQMCLM